MLKDKKIPNSDEVVVDPVKILQNILETQKEMIKLTLMVGQQLNRTDQKVDLLIQKEYPGLKSTNGGIITSKT